MIQEAIKTHGKDVELVSVDGLEGHGLWSLTGGVVPDHGA